MSTAKGSDVRPGVPRAPALCASFAWVGHTPWCAALGPHLFCNAGVGQYALPRDRMYAVASLGLHVFCVASAGQSVRCQGVDICTGAIQAPLLLRGRREALYIAKGSDVHRGVPRLMHLLRGRHGAMCIAGGVCVAGLGHCAQSPSLSIVHFYLFSIIDAFAKITHTLTHWLTHPLTHSLHSLTSLKHSITHSHSVTFTASLPSSLPHSLTHLLTVRVCMMSMQMSGAATVCGPIRMNKERERDS